MENEKKRIQKLEEENEQLRKRVRELEQTEEVLNNNANFTSALLKAIPTPVFFKDREGRYQGCNRAFTDLMGVSEDDIRGKTVHELWPGEHAKKYHQQDLALMEKPEHQQYEFKVKDRDGNIRPVLFAKDVFRDASGEVIGIVGAFLDIAIQKKTEADLRESRENLRITLNSIGDAVITTDTEGRIRRMNPVASTLCGWDGSESRGRPLSEAFHIINARSRERVENPVEKVLESGAIIGLANHTVLIARDGTEYQIADSAAPIRQVDGSIVGVVLVFRDVSEEYRLQERLKENEDRFSKTLLAANDGMWDWNLETNKVYFDPRYYTMAGYEVDAFPHRLEEFQKRVHPDDFDKLMAHSEAHLKGEAERFQIEFRFQKKDGSWMWIFGRGIIVERNDDGSPRRFIGTHSDISARKEVEEALRAKSEELEKFFTTTLDLLCIADADGHFIRVNKEWEHVLGYSTEELENRKFLEFVHPDDMDVTLEKMKDLSEQKDVRQFINRYLCQDGTYRYIEWRSTPQTAGRIYAAARDVTDFKKAQEALEESEKNLRTTLNSIGDAVISTDLVGNIIRMNPVAEDLTGWREEEAKGQALENVFRVIDEKDRETLESPVQKVLETGRIVNLSKDTFLVARNGSEYRIADSGAPILADDGSISGVVLVFRDISEEYALQQKMQQSQKLDAVGQLASGVAHDFNNMLGGIMGGAELLQTMIPDGEDSRRYISIIMESAERAADLAGKLLAFSRQKTPGSTAIEIHNIINATISILKNTIDKRIRINLEDTAESGLVIGDDAQLQSVFLNLGINAAHAMAEGGSLSYRVRNVVLSEMSCQNSPFELEPGQYVEVSVCDTGEGIPEENQTRIFEPFYTTKEQGKGTGLGLAAAYGVVQQHKGAISVYSELDEGTCFYVLLPLTEEAAAELRTSEDAVSGKGLVLLVDDEAVMQATGEALLVSYGYEVLLAKNGQEAVDIFRDRHQDLALVILDMVMPEMNGRDCFHHLREIDPAIPVIISSGFTRQEDVKDMKGRGLAGFIKKPFRGSELSKVIADIVRTEPGNT